MRRRGRTDPRPGWLARIARRTPQGRPHRNETALAHVHRLRRIDARCQAQKSMSPPPPGMAGAEAFSGLSATTASVVRNKAAMDAAFCSADRVTLAGSMIPAVIRFLYSPVAA